MSGAAARVEVLDDPGQVAALAHPLRVAILDALRSPGSAAGAARALGETRQKVNHHVKALLDAGLLRPEGERRTGNFVEQLYQSVAGSFMVSPRLACGGDRRVDALRSQVPLEHLTELGERVQRDAIGLLDRAAFDGEEIPSLSVEASVRFPDEASRAAFMEEYLGLIKPLLRKHGAREGDAFRVVTAVYPERTA
ncbi:MAG TPA: helix-turn-helix domain-containing protein [Acidimicrobiales bacterium]|nr:helix-turn-helix domain-containing protein [Acidimicrobiales bacterium]